MFVLIERSTQLRRSMVLWMMIWMIVPPSAWANPTGGSVSSGSATITGGSGNTTIQQQSQRAIIRWNDFSINQGETTTFVQPNSQSATLNRVTGGNASQLNGTLNANGKVYLVNPNGVVVGKTGRINTASFTASTHDVSDAEFNAGGDMTFRGNSKASVINEGKIRATDGDVTLIARQVQNNGRITARKGSVNLAGGTEVLIKPSGDQRVYIRGGSGSVANNGSIRATAAELRAAGGNEYALAVNNTGVIRATKVDRSGGRIVLRAESGATRNSGSLIARSKAAGKDGGRIDVTGDTVAVTHTSKIDAGSTYGKGGTVNLGGGFQGKDPSVKNAKTTLVQSGSSTKADGGTQGGSVVVWSDEATGYYGDISAKGPGLAGTGGSIEVSSHGYLEFAGGVQTGGGTVLLDPSNVRIVADAVGGSNYDDSVPPNIVSIGNATRIPISAINTMLATGNDVIIQTNAAYSPATGLQSAITGNTRPGDIVVETQINMATGYSLTLRAHDDIVVLAPVYNDGDGGINLIANYGNSGGSVFINHVNATIPVWVGSRGGTTTIQGYDLVVQGSNGTDSAFAQVGYGSSYANGADINGDINITMAGTVKVLGGGRTASFAQIGHGGYNTTPNTAGGDITIQSGDLLLQSGAGQYGYAQVGHGGAKSTTNNNLTGTIYILAFNSIILKSTTGQYAYTQIGHGGQSSEASYIGDPIDFISTNILLASSTLQMTGGTKQGGYSMIGNGGRAFHTDGSILTTILLNSGDVSMTSRFGAGAFVQIGNGGQTSKINGNILGDIRFADYTANVSMTAQQGTNAYVQIGHGGVDSKASQVTGDIYVYGSNSVYMQAKEGDSAYVQIGHGGADSNSEYLSGNILVGGTRSTVTLTTGGGNRTYAQIGHGGYDVQTGTIISSNISVAGSSISLHGATSYDPSSIGVDYAQIGHGGAAFSADGDVEGNITITTGSLSLAGGSGFGADYAMIGHGGMASEMDNILGNITVIHSGAVTLTGGESVDSFAMIGHGGGAYVAPVCGCHLGDITGNISVIGKGDISLTGGNADGAQVLIGHGGGAYTGTAVRKIAGNITVSGSNISLTGGEEGLTYAQIGHSITGTSAMSATDPAQLVGNIDVTFTSLLQMNAGNTFGGAYVQIGHGGSPVIPYGSFPLFSKIAGDITVTGLNEGSFIAVVGGGACPCYPASYALIGHGGQGLAVDWNAGPSGGPGTMDGNISIAAGSLYLQGGVGEGAFAQVGHHEMPIDTMFPLPLPPRYRGGILSGNISIILSEDLTMVGGKESLTYVLIGHGTNPVEDSDGKRSGQIVIRVGGETSLEDGGTGGGNWWIGHRNQNPSKVTNADILLETGTLDYDASSTSTATTINDRLARVLGTALRRGNVTLISTNTEGGLIYEGLDPYSLTRPDSIYTMSLLSKGDLTIKGPLLNDGNGSFFAVAGFDGTSGIYGITGSPLVDTSKFTAPSTAPGNLIINGNVAFGNNVTLVAGSSILIQSAGNIGAGGDFLAIVDNFNATRPDYDAESLFTNLGTITVKGKASIYAVAPELVTLGNFNGLGTGRLTDIWYGDADAITGANFKLATWPVPTPPEPPEPPLPPEPPTPTVLPTLEITDNPDDRLRKPVRIRTSQRFQIFYSQNQNLSAQDRARLWLNSYQIVPESSHEVSAP